MTDQKIRTVRVPTFGDVERALPVVRAVLPPTPLTEAVGTAGHALRFKLESFQPTGSFKVRGALNALSNTAGDEPVVTASAGNHGLGVAFAASRLGRHATVVVPGNASPKKVAALREFGVELVHIGQSYAEAEAHALELAARGARFVSPYNDPDVIAGQGTIGLELDAQLDPRDGPFTVVTGVGGGGLISGIGLWASTRDDVRLVGVEPTAAAAMAASVRAGQVARIDLEPTIADGINANLEPGSATVGLVTKHVDELVTVTEDELRVAMREYVARRGLVAEAAGAAGYAALLAGKLGPRAGTTVVVLTGRNVALPLLAEILNEP